MSFGTFVRKAANNEDFLPFVNLTYVNTHGPFVGTITNCRTAMLKDNAGQPLETAIIDFEDKGYSLALSSKSILVDITQALGDPGEDGGQWIGQTVELRSGKGRWSPNATLRLVRVQPAAPGVRYVNDTPPPLATEELPF